MRISRNILRVKPSKPYLRVVFKNNRKTCRLKLIVEAIRLVDELHGTESGLTFMLETSTDRSVYEA